MNQYYAAHGDIAVVFSNKTDRDTFCQGNVFQPIGFYEFATRDLLGGWYMVRDFTGKEPSKAETQLKRSQFPG